eukprot:contig_25156_g6206
MAATPTTAPGDGGSGGSGGNGSSSGSDHSVGADPAILAAMAAAAAAVWGPNPPPSPAVPGGWRIAASDRSRATVNPIRNLVQGIGGSPNPEKELLDLSVGDPTAYGNLRVPDEVLDAAVGILRGRKHNGYAPSFGLPAAREAVAARYTTPAAPLTPEDVVMTVGTSGALELAIGAVANAGQSVLMARPGFPLFRTLAEGMGVRVATYDLLPDAGWEVDLDSLAAAVDDTTAAVIVNNPSNPCGSVYSAAHLAAIAAVASAARLPIIADEVYAGMAFDGVPWTPLSSVSADVPVLTVGGLSKQSVVPGWRCGWLLLHDAGGVLTSSGVRAGVRALTTRMMAPHRPTQALVPTLLSDAPAIVAARGDLLRTLADHAAFAVTALAGVPALTVLPAAGSMYVMVRVDCAALGLVDDAAFVAALRSEESVFVLPGACFDAPGYVRLVFCAPRGVLSEAFARMRAFCVRRVGRK